MIRTKIETNFTIFFTMWKSSPQATTPLPPWKKIQELACTSIISKHAQYVHSVQSAPTYMHVNSRPWLETTMFMFLMPVPSTPTPPPLFLKNFWIRDMMWCWSFTFVGQIASTCTGTCICILHPLPRNIGFLRFANMLFYLFFWTMPCYVPVEVCSVFVH